MQLPMMQNPLSLRLALRPRLSGLSAAHVWSDATRMSVAAVAAFVAARALHLPGGYWAVISALMVTRQSGASLTGLVDRLAGMALGLSVGLSLALARYLHLGSWRVPDLVLIAAAIVPLCFVVARFRKYQMAPIAAIMVLSAGVAVTAALHAALFHVGEMLLGAAIGIVVSALLLRQTADERSRAQAARTLDGCADLLIGLAAPRGRVRDAGLRQRIRGDLRQVMLTSRLNNGEGEALGKTQIVALGRLQADISFFGRAVFELRGASRLRSQDVITQFAESFAQACRSLGAHLQGRGPRPDLMTLDHAAAQLRAACLERDAASGGEHAQMALPFVAAVLRADIMELMPVLAVRDAAAA